MRIVIFKSCHGNLLIVSYYEYTHSKGESDRRAPPTSSSLLNDAQFSGEDTRCALENKRKFDPSC